MTKSRCRTPPAGVEPGTSSHIGRAPVRVTRLGGNVMYCYVTHHGLYSSLVSDDKVIETKKLCPLFWEHLEAWLFPLFWKHLEAWLFSLICLFSVKWEEADWVTKSPVRHKLYRVLLTK